MAERKVRVRFAPSPTGALHIGGVRTALYNYLFARQHGGDLIFRIEDTDSNRFVPGAEEYILESFKWLGIHFDEGVSFGGEQGPYRQSERREIYKKYVQILLENGKAYIAFDTPEELDAKRAEIANFQYDASTRGMMRNSLTMPKEEVDALIAEALHIGGVRTALYNYLFARQHGGDLIFRIEDTDSNRFVPGAEEYILESFKWLGIHFDEGVSFGGEQGPYRQSERREIYKKYVQILLENGKAYIAFDTPEELDAKRAEIANFQYDASTRGMMRNSLTMPKEEVDALIAEGKQYVVRFKIEPNEDIHVNDLIRGEVVINSSILDDKVLYKSADELPTYHLANIVDDHLMEVSHVIRGEEWLPSAPLHVLLYRAFGWEDTMPEFAHLPLLLKPEGNGKLSKRDGDRLGFPVFPLEWHDPKSGEISSGYRESGYLPEAVINFLALLGWNPGNDLEVMSMDELIKLFDLHRCSKSGAKFDYKKGIWFNHQYIQQKPNEEIAELFLPFLKEHGVEAPFEKVVTVVGMMKDRVSFIKELWDVCSFFFVAPTEYDEKTVKKRWKEDSAKCMTELAEVIAGIEDFSIEGQEKVVMDWIAEKGYHTGNIMNAFRLTLVGEGKGPHMFDISWVLGKEETIARMKRAVEVLK